MNFFVVAAVVVAVAEVVVAVAKNTKPTFGLVMIESY